MEKRQSTTKSGVEKPVTLAPLSFNEALAGLLQVPPTPNKEISQKTKRTPKPKGK